MKTISFVSQKGGTGKTTLCLSVAVEAMRSGYTVAVVDLDPQPSSMAWSDLRPRHDPPVFDAKASRLASAVDVASKQGLDLLFVDTGGRTDEGAQVAAQVSDLVVVPIQPSAVDLASMDATRLLIERSGNPASMVVLSRVKPFGTRHDEIGQALTTRGFKVCPAMIGDRVTFQDAFAAGQTVREYEPNGKAAQEVADLYSVICRRIDIPTNRPVKVSTRRPANTSTATQQADTTPAARAKR